MALGVHLAAEAAGLRVPDDLAVTGWDDVLAARFAGLTTVRQPMRELGATAARWLHRRIEERTADPARQAGSTDPSAGPTRRGDGPSHAARRPAQLRHPSPPRR